jgi:hypothetical protein
MLTMAVTASKAAASPSRYRAITTAACKPRANCLNLKEIRKRAMLAAGGVLTCSTS